MNSSLSNKLYRRIVLMVLLKQLLVILFSLLGFSLGQRSPREEAICRPFLTSRETSPLIANLRRNLTMDEDGEFACEIVLQDVDLPIQIRVTIHEGLSWLATRHVQMGLQRQKTIVRHLNVLADAMKSNFDFSYRAGVWCMDAGVSEPLKAVKYLSNALYGNASTDSKASLEDKHTARYEYMRALGQLGRHEDAKAELIQLLSGHPLDFDSAALLNEIKHAIAGDDDSSDSYVDKLLESVQSAYRGINKLGVNHYEGFVPSHVWKPTRYSSLLSEEQFSAHITRREPFIISFGSTAELDTALSWNTHQWLSTAPYSKQYLSELIGLEEEVLVESRAVPNDCLHDQQKKEDASANTKMCDAVFGFSSGSRRKVVTMQSLLERDFMDNDNTGSNSNSELLYMNIQLAGAGQGKYRTPLHKLQNDIPPPMSMLSAVWNNVTDISLWMGDAKNGDSHSKLHMDATDNLYVLLEGIKEFAILSPQHALSTQTVAPTYAVTPDGLSFQFKTRAFREYYRKHEQLLNQTRVVEASTDGESTALTQENDLYYGVK